MGKTFSIIKPGTQGVDGATDPLRLQGKLRHAVNLQFQSGELKTRPVYEYMKLGLKGQFQGASMFKPSLGISFRPFGECGSRLATAVSGKIFVNNAPDTGVQCNPMELKNSDLPLKCGREADELCSGDIHIYQAENILVIQSPRRNTMWWTGEGDLVVSPGMVSDSDQNPEAHSSDSFRTENHKNFLINGAGLGIFWNGRIHQQGPHGIFVGDLIHKRGSMATDDIVLMEEQSLACCGPPLSTNSKMGSLMALEGVPEMGTANGEGDLIGYYDGGVVRYNTFIFPRASKFSAKGERLAEGWDTKQMVKHNCNVVTAVGRYAVGVLPRDHFFRSGFGIHILSKVLGVEFINDEPVNVISDEVSHILNEDEPCYLHGAAAGCWFQGHRWFMTTGFESLPGHSSSPMARGFVSWNKVWGKTLDKTPVTAWEGVWTVDDSIAGIHRFIHPGMREDRGCFGFLCSDGQKNLWFAAIRESGSCDVRDGKAISVPWAFETGRFDFGDTTRTKEVTDGRFECSVRTKGVKVTVYVRSDVSPQWTKWRVLSICDSAIKPGEKFKFSKSIGQPPESIGEATWFEFRVEGTGAAEITGFDVEFSEGSGKMDTDFFSVVKDCVNTPPLATTL
jgi:hypothetical protein